MTAMDGAPATRPAAPAGAAPGPSPAPAPPAGDCFAQTYADARERFLDAARSAGLALQSHDHPLRGRDGEALALDVARFGDPGARALLVLSSGCHGVEGFCGSGIQVSLLRDRAFHRAAADAGVALLYLHALNPWGFSWWRRTTEDNVDLNRNFCDFGAALPANPAYEALAPFLLPPAWPSPPEAEAALAAYARQHGAAALRAAISAGQYVHPQGLFYGGREPSWSQRMLRRSLREHAGRCERLGWIDFHTGLGPRGHGERIFACRDDAQALARARAWWGSAVTSIYDGSSSSALLVGLMFNAAYDECAQARYTGIALEFGTVPFDEMVTALRADQWVVNQGADDAVRQAVKQRLRDVFYVDSDEWKQAVVDQGHEAALQGVRGLGSG